MLFTAEVVFHAVSLECSASAGAATIMFVVRVPEQGHFGPPILLVSKSFEERSITQ